MKKLFFLIQFVLLSCKKEIATQKTISQDSVFTENQAQKRLPKDSASTKESTVLTKVSNEDSRIFEGNKIIQTIDASKIPIAINDEFTKDDQQLIIKIKNFKGSKIIGKIIPENETMNIRFNQIKLADGEFDGPFGRDISYNIKKSGEIWLTISKSNMVSGDANGKFSISVK